MRSARRGLIRLGASVLAVGAVLYLVLVFPDDTRRILPKEVPYDWVNVGLVVVLLLLILTLIRYVRGLGDEG
jgi:hypothetical protein